ncbi:redoxin domain-containing protein [Maioricimonas sp. JC845]|uniref:redoxin domain-containing protein n=1 Tax=Maioricimonas sp. JC845 TaxID=3232138 RepID=UPI0034584C4E
MKYRPVQPGVDYETPDARDFSQCKVEVERSGKSSGWVVLGPQGQVLRRFVDSDGDNVVDQWRYYRHGLEVYRDIDTNGNSEVDQSRWLNTGGTRWGIDTDEDGKIDTWKILSAEEASREAIRAMVTSDARSLQRLMLTAADVQQLKIDRELADKLLANTGNVGQQLQSVLSKSRVIKQSTQWIRFDSSMLMPSLIPSEDGKAANDLYVYENVMALVDTDGQSGFVQIGEMVRVGDVWKLTRVPQPLEGETLEITEGGLLMQPSLASLTVGPTGGLTPEMQELIDKLRKLDEGAPGVNGTRDATVRYNVARAGLLQQLANASATNDERHTWLRQRIDGIAAAVQMGAYPNGLAELKSIEQQIAQTPGDAPLVPYVTFRRVLAEYNTELQTADAADRAKVQEQFLSKLQQFAADFPKAEDTPDALLQLAITNEFNGQVDKAREWYEKLVKDYAESTSATRARGALNRVNLPGSSLQFSGQVLGGGGTLDLSRYRGKVLAVVFWATWCKPCTEELPQLQELYRQYRQQGFEVVGINVDSPGAPIQQYIQQHKVPWPHIHEEGGLESRPAQQFGIITLPTMFLVDKSGKVVSSNVSLDELKTQVPELLK